ncbi:uncharacterized protein LOC119110351 [Pollicipes pollicipes]|uniref:uncharacterized protein LOC119110351 n=1 Tax=Pollicipes pollicipes TaxID=41117 RepID=UPI0018849F9A|nr:uncharacterized protein LOC119110351 [Pollicipes pollicipes]
MRVVILGAGYGTRFQRDADADASGQYSHLSGIPKPLLPIGDAPLVTHWIRDLEDVTRHEPVEIEEVVVVVNVLNKPQFEQWQAGLTTPLKVTLTCDGASSNDTRPGAIACMAIGVGNNWSRDVLFIGGDTLFPREFSLAGFLRAAQQQLGVHPGSCHVTAVPCPEERVSRHGIVELDDQRCVVGFKEKPQPSETTSRLQCPCFYLIPAATLGRLEAYLASHASLAERDATGLLVAELARQGRVVAHPSPGRYDVGSLETYRSCCQAMAAGRGGAVRTANC